MPKTDIPKLPRGVLKIKTGYNPNSSSIGTAVHSLPYLLTVVSAVLAALAVLIGKGPRKP